MAFTSLDVLSRNPAMLSGCPGSHDLLLHLRSQGWHLFVCSCIKLVCFTSTSSRKIDESSTTHWPRPISLDSSFFQSDKSLRQVAYISYDKMAKHTCEEAFAYRQLGVGFFLLYEFIHAYVLCSEIAHVVGGSTWIQRNIPIKTM